MKKYLMSSFLFLFSVNSIGSGNEEIKNLLCVGKSAFRTVFEEKIELRISSSHSTWMFLGKIGQIEASIRQTSNQGFELQLYDPTLPARYYSSGDISSSSNGIELAIWSHRENVDLSCRPLPN